MRGVRSANWFPSETIAIYSLILLCGGVCLIVFTLPKGLPGLQNVYSAAGVYFVIVGICLWCRTKWSPWLYLLAMVGVTLWSVYGLIANGFSLGRAGGIVGCLVGLSAFRDVRRNVLAESRWARLVEATEGDFCSATYSRICNHYGDRLDVSKLSTEERTVLLAYSALGKVLNGGFNCLFEASVPGDPHYALTAAAYETIGCEPAVRAFREALALFPDSTPPADVDIRLPHYRGGDGTLRGQIDMAFWNAEDKIVRCLGEYIRSNQQAFAHLPPPSKQFDFEEAINAVRSGRTTYIERRTEGEGPTLAELPHWARVAFVARCCRQLLPLFDQNWPNAPPARRKAIVDAIELAEQSAALGRAVAGLGNAKTQAVMTAGGALNAIYKLLDEPCPPDGNMGLIASHVAKTAEHVAATAESLPSESVEPAMEAYTFALDASDADEFHAAMKRDLLHLNRLAIEGDWTDATVVPAKAWDA